MSRVAHVYQEKKRTTDVSIAENISFKGLLLSDSVLNGLKNAGFERPSPIQLKAIPLGRCGLDLIVQAKSGTGKTCVFSVIALEGIHTESTATQVLVLAPTREIAVQIWDVINSIGSAMKSLQCHTFIGGLPLHEDRVKLKKCHIAVGSPGRIKQLIEGGVLRTDSIRLFVLDEADKLLEEGFQEQINWIYSTLPDNKQMLALSATYPEFLADHLTAYMRNPTFLRLNVSDPALLGIRQYYASVAHHPMSQVVFERKTELLVHILSSVAFQQCLVFSNLQTRAQTLADELINKGWPTACIAGCLDQKDRNHAMARLKTYKCRILISTDLTSRGIDADKVNMVINLDVPKDHETYLHRIGRAGRFGSFGIAINLLSEGQEQLNLNSIEKRCNTQVNPLPDPLPSDLARPDAPVNLDDLVSSEVIHTKPHLPQPSSPGSTQRKRNGEAIAVDASDGKDICDNGTASNDTGQSHPQTSSATQKGKALDKETGHEENQQNSKTPYSNPKASEKAAEEMNVQSIEICDQRRELIDKSNGKDPVDSKTFSNDIKTSGVILNEEFDNKSGTENRDALTTEVTLIKKSVNAKVNRDRDTCGVVNDVVEDKNCQISGATELETGEPAGGKNKADIEADRDKAMTNLERRDVLSKGDADSTTNKDTGTKSSNMDSCNRLIDESKDGLKKIDAIQKVPKKSTVNESASPSLNEIQLRMTENNLAFNVRNNDQTKTMAEKIDSGENVDIPENGMKVEHRKENRIEINKKKSEELRSKGKLGRNYKENGRKNRQGLPDFRGDRRSGHETLDNGLNHQSLITDKTRGIAPRPHSDTFSREAVDKLQLQPVDLVDMFKTNIGFRKLSNPHSYKSACESLKAFRAQRTADGVDTAADTGSKHSGDKVNNEIASHSREGIEQLGHKQSNVEIHTDVHKDTELLKFNVAKVLKALEDNAGGALFTAQDTSTYHSRTDDKHGSDTDIENMGAMKHDPNVLLEAKNKTIKDDLPISDDVHERVLVDNNNHGGKILSELMKLEITDSQVDLDIRQSQETEQISQNSDTSSRVAAKPSTGSTNKPRKKRPRSNYQGKFAIGHLLHREQDLDHEDVTNDTHCSNSSDTTKAVNQSCYETESKLAAAKKELLSSKELVELCGTKFHETDENGRSMLGLPRNQRKKEHCDIPQETDSSSIDSDEDSSSSDDETEDVRRTVPHHTKHKVTPYSDESSEDSRSPSDETESSSSENESCNKGSGESESDERRTDVEAGAKTKSISRENTQSHYRQEVFPPWTSNSWMPQEARLETTKKKNREMSNNETNETTDDDTSSSVRQRSKYDNKMTNDKSRYRKQKTQQPEDTVSGNKTLQQWYEQYYQWYQSANHSNPLWPYAQYQNNSMRSHMPYPWYGPQAGFYPYAQWTPMVPPYLCPPSGYGSSAGSVPPMGPSMPFSAEFQNRYVQDMSNMNSERHSTRTNRNRQTARSKSKSKK